MKTVNRTIAKKTMDNAMGMLAAMDINEELAAQCQGPNAEAQQAPPLAGPQMPSAFRNELPAARGRAVDCRAW